MEKRGKKVSKTEKHAIFFLAENEAKCQIFGGYFCIMTNFLRLIWYRIFDARFNGAIFNMIHGISAVLFKILKIWSRKSWKIMLGWFVWIFCWFISILLLKFSVDGPKLWPGLKCVEICPLMVRFLVLKFGIK